MRPSTANPGRRPRRPTTAAWLGAAAALLAAHPAGAGPSFPPCENPAPGAGDCFYVTKGVVGCTDPVCCSLVCKIDESCCTDFWSLDCAVHAELNCEPPPLCPGKGGSCLEPHGTPSCDDVECCNLLCLLDAFCCYYVWDQLCVMEAMQLCGVGPCAVAPPPGAVAEPEPCGQRLNDGCNLDAPAFTAIACGQTFRGDCFAFPPRDTDWYSVNVTAPATLTWTVAPEFPAQLMILDGACEPAINILAQSYADGCRAQSVSLCVQPGTYFLFVAPGTAARPINTDLICEGIPKVDPGFYSTRYLATLTCSGCPGSIPADLSGDGHVTGIDLALLLGQWTGASLYAPCPPHRPADLNQDCRVNGLDLAILLGAWG